MITTVSSLLAGAIVLAMSVPLGVRAEIVRDDFEAIGENGLRLFVREVRDTGAEPRGVPVLLLHGARSGVLASFDIDRPAGYSLAADLARRGHRVFLMDARGYGLSEYPPEMAEDPFAHPPLVDGNEVVRDVDAVVAALKARTGAERFAMLGWATGSQWLGHYASLHPENVERLVYFNGIVSGPGPWPLAEQLSKPGGASGEFDVERFGAYRVQTAEDLVGRFDDGTHDPAFVRRYQALSLAGDEEGAKATPPTFRVPTGALAESLAMTAGRTFWDPSAITAPVLIVRSEDDFWSRREDPARLQAALVRSPSVRIVTLTGASHYVHLEPGPVRERFVAEIARFFAGEAS